MGFFFLPLPILLPSILVFFISSSVRSLSFLSHSPLPPPSSLPSCPHNSFSVLTVLVCSDIDTSVCRQTADQTDPTVVMSIYLLVHIVSTRKKGARTHCLVKSFSWQLARWDDDDPVYSLLDPSNINAGVRMELQNGDECLVDNRTLCVRLLLLF